MDRSNVINLITETHIKDRFGVSVPTTTSRQVFCQIDSVTRTEFFEAGRNGLNPEMMITMFYGDYNGEKIVEVNGERFGVYRVYRNRSDTIELYVERKGGTNGGN